MDNSRAIIIHPIVLLAEELKCLNSGLFRKPNFVREGWMLLELPDDLQRAAEDRAFSICDTHHSKKH